MAETQIRRGRIIQVPFTALPVADAARESRRWVVISLVLLLPMLFECFNYMIDARVLYTVAKIWPISMVPFFLYGLLYLDLPYKMFYMVLLAYTVAVSPIISMLQLDNNFIEAFVSSNKVWPFIYYFATASLLRLLRPNSAQLRTALLILAIGTFAIFWLLWLGVPDSSYRSDPAQSQVFYIDDERGRRIVLPVGFAMIGLFYVARSFSKQPQLWQIILLVAGVTTLVIIYKQRTPIGIAIPFLLTILSTRLAIRIRLLMICCGALLILVLLVFQFQDLTNTLGGSLSVRQQSIGLAYDFLRDHPLRWLFGSGSTTAFSNTTLQDILGSNQFYLADIGWLGVVFEYGLVGAGLIGCFVITSWQQAVKAGREGGAWLQAVADYALFLILVSAVYSVVYIPGEMATISAIALYGRRINSFAPLPGVYEHAR